MSVTGELPRDGPTSTSSAPPIRDMHLRPDPSTVRIVPWATDPTAQVIHDCYDADGRLVPFAPRSVLRRVCELYDDAGLEPGRRARARVLPGRAQQRPRHAAAARRSAAAAAPRPRARSYSIDAVNEFDPLFEDVYDYCEKMELNVDTLIHEIGAGQMEINFFHGDPLALADEVFFFKRTVREAALRHDMYATFMAKPIAGEPGSAMHVHQSVVDKATRPQPLQQRRTARRAREFCWYIGGLQRYMPAAMALFAPYVNSYRRLARFTAAPINIQWGTDNRTVGIRSPVAGAAGAPRREPRHRRRRQSRTSRWRPRWPAATSASQSSIEPTPECNGQRLPRATTSCRAAWARRCSCCATTTTCATCSATSS